MLVARLMPTRPSLPHISTQRFVCREVAGHPRVSPSARLHFTVHLHLHLHLNHNLDLDLDLGPYLYLKLERFRECLHRALRDRDDWDLSTHKHDACVPLLFLRLQV